jgi:hypothetical protein
MIWHWLVGSEAVQVAGVVAVAVVMGPLLVKARPDDSAVS